MGPVFARNELTTSRLSNIPQNEEMVGDKRVFQSRPLSQLSVDNMATEEVQGESNFSRVFCCSFRKF